MNKEIQKCIDAATTKKQSNYLDPELIKALFEIWNLKYED